ncbi:MAG: hypothetical protein ORN98_07775 [Alphaproteobacteria bacterium]|nr:hypothetical protein [Alphaproteobacteria bacterium]
MNFNDLCETDLNDAILKSERLATLIERRAEKFAKAARAMEVAKITREFDHHHINNFALLLRGWAVMARGIGEAATRKEGT